MRGDAITCVSPRPKYVGDPAALVDQVIAANVAKADDYRAGKTGLLGFFVGQVMRQSGGNANPALVSQLVQERLGAEARAVSSSSETAGDLGDRQPFLWFGRRFLEPELRADRSLYGFDVGFRQNASPIDQTLFAGGRQLVSHCLSLLTIQRYERLARIQAVYVAGNRYHLQPVQMLIRHIIADDDCRPLLPRLPPRRTGQN
jgi:hypothetical protein